MSGFISQVLNAGTSEVQRDWRHAARTFTDANYRLAPKNDWLFYVRFIFNQSATALSATGQLETSVLVKNIDLPQFTLDIVEANAYNRKRYYQKKIEYQDVNIVFHDDMADTIRNFWVDYYQHYYADGTYAVNSFDDPIYGQQINQYYGLNYNGGNTNHNRYIDSIEIYSMYQKVYTQYTLVNPILTKFGHGKLDNYSTNGQLQNTLTVKYETVLYNSGSCVDIPGLTTIHYDAGPSPLTAYAGATQSVFGPGGLVSGASTVLDDLQGGNLLGAVIAGYNTVKTAGTYNIGQALESELGTALQGTLSSYSPTSAYSFPTANMYGLSQSAIPPQSNIIAYAGSPLANALDANPNSVVTGTTPNGGTITLGPQYVTSNGGSL